KWVPGWRTELLEHRRANLLNNARRTRRAAPRKVPSRRYAQQSLQSGVLHHADQNCAESARQDRRRDHQRIHCASPGCALARQLRSFPNVTARSDAKGYAKMAKPVTRL